MADKTSFTKDEWTLLLKSPMIAGMAITAADPSGLWGLLKESFAGGAALTKVATDSSANALVKAVVADFSTSEGRSAARDGLKADFAGGKPADIKTKSVDSTAPGFGLAELQRRPAMPLRSKAGCVRSVKAPPKQRPKAAACSAAAFR